MIYFVPVISGILDRDGLPDRSLNNLRLTWDKYRCTVSVRYDNDRGSDDELLVLDMIMIEALTMNC